MRLRVLAVGQKMPDWVEQGIAEYSRRMPRECRVDWVDIPLARRGKGAAYLDRDKEGQAILAKLAPDDYVVALDVGGKDVTTEGIASKLQDWQMQGSRVALLIGGPDGLAPDLLTAASESWSFGRVTLPHPLVRVILAEQLYRAWSITVGHPYHRGE
jgi:23S rRNA (pseudouridine1915-N3)-methyltransferase